LGQVLGAGLGFVAGCFVLGLGPRWPPSEDRDRFLAVLLPLVVLVECVAAFESVPRRAAWALRLAVAAVAAPVLLHQTTYLTDAAGPGTREWTPAQAWLILGSLAAVLSALWTLLTMLQARVPGPRANGGLAVVCAAAGVTVMLSGYSTGGQLAVPLAAALAGVVAAALVLPPAHDGQAAGVGVVGLFAVLLVGRSFGTLSTGPALCLLLAPLLCWVPEAPGLRRLGPRARDAAALVLITIPLMVVVTSAHRTFVADSAAPSSPGEPSLQNYLDFGK
jgi:hypothetical protein